MTLHWKKELIEACKRGNRNAQRELYDQYKDAMYNVALRIVKNSHDAEDILVASFTDVFQNLKSYDFRATPGAWIKRIVINNSLSFLKKKKVELVFPEHQLEPMIEEESDYYALPEIGKVKKCIQDLPQGYRMVLSLYLIEGYDHAEISEIMDISIATSKSQYSRARKKLKEMIAIDLGQTAN